jgi:carbonic anhydrase
LLKLQPGDVFVHHNIGNLVHPTDISVMSVIDYTVVRVGICGHTNCGACNGALSPTKFGLLDTWLHPLRKLEAQNAFAPTDSEKLAELSVRLSVEAVRENANMMAVENSVDVHGFIYDLATGCLRDLNCQSDAAKWEMREGTFHLTAELALGTAAIGSKGTLIIAHSQCTFRRITPRNGIIHFASRFGPDRMALARFKTSFRF